MKTENNPKEKGRRRKGKEVAIVYFYTNDQGGKGIEVCLAELHKKLNHRRYTEMAEELAKTRRYEKITIINIIHF